MRSAAGRRIRDVRGGGFGRLRTAPLGTRLRRISKLQTVSVEPPAAERFQTMIVGGGVAGLEAALALRDLAGDRITLRMLAPNSDFVYRPLAVQEPFSMSGSREYPLEAIAEDVGFELIQDALREVDPTAREVLTNGGATHSYDALLLGLGARIRAAYEHATTIDDRRLDELLHGLIQDVEGGYTKRLAFVIPARMAWPLPVYELALMTSARAFDSSAGVEITIVTPEDSPLAIFGIGASQAVAALLAEREIEVITSAYCEIPESGVVEISPGDRTARFDRIVALPELEGPAIPGLPEAPEGFIPIDANCQVHGIERVYAAGDATDFAVKYGGIAAQQADTAAHEIAALAGLSVAAEPFHPVIHGVLLTGEQPRYLSAHITGGHGASSELSEQPSWDPPVKIAARHLAAYLDQFDHSTGRTRQDR